MIKEVINFIFDVKKEALKVSWVSKNEAISATFMVVVIVLISALFFMFIDFSVYWVIQFFINLGV